MIFEPLTGGNTKMLLEAFGEILGRFEGHTFRQLGNGDGGVGQDLPSHKHLLLFIIDVGGHLIFVAKQRNNVILRIMKSLTQCIQRKGLVQMIINASFDLFRQSKCLRYGAPG